MPLQLELASSVSSCMAGPLYVSLTLRQNTKRRNCQRPNKDESIDGIHVYTVYTWCGSEAVYTCTRRVHACTRFLCVLRRIDRNHRETVPDCSRTSLPNARNPRARGPGGAACRSKWIMLQRLLFRYGNEKRLRSSGVVSLLVCTMKHCPYSSNRPKRKLPRLLARMRQATQRGRSCRTKTPGSTRCDPVASQPTRSRR